MKPNIADIKAILAERGATCPPDSVLHEVSTPVAKGDNSTSVIVLDVVTDKHPNYCTHGFTTCAMCREPLWLGHNSIDVVLGQEAVPLCRDCANKVIPKSQQPTYNVGDTFCGS